MEPSKLTGGEVDLLRTILIRDHNCAATCGWDFVQKMKLLTNCNLACRMSDLRAFLHAVNYPITL